MKSTSAVLEDYFLVLRIRLCNAHGHVLHEGLQSHDAGGLLIVLESPFVTLGIEFVFI